MDSGDPEKKKVRVVIFNQTYTLRTSGDGADTEQLAQVVDELMSSVAARAGKLDDTRVAVLACLHLADRLRALEHDLEGLRERVSKKSEDFSRLLDQALD